MKPFRMLGRNFRDALKNVFRNFSLSLASISCITITLLVVAISIVLTYNVNNFTKLVEEDVTIVAFLKNDISDEQVNSLGESIKNLDHVLNYSYQNKQEIAKDMMEDYEDLRPIMETWEDLENPLQPTYRVKVDDIKNLDETAEAIEKMENVEIVKWGQDLVEDLITVFDAIRKISLGMVVALVIVTAFLIANTIKITIFSRKREIEIMRLVGASNINIRIPFFFEGMFLGIMGSIIPIAITIYGYISIYKNFNGQIISPFIQLLKPEPFVYIVSLVLIVIGMLVGMFGSLRAVRKYLKV